MANTFAAEDAIVVPYQSVSVLLSSFTLRQLTSSYSDVEFRCTYAPSDSVSSRWRTDCDPVR